MLEAEVSRAELDVPLGDSPDGVGVVEDILEWCTTGHCYRVLVEVVRHLAGGHEDGVDELMVMRLPLLGTCEDFTQVVDRSLNTMGLAFF